ncbi:MAG: serine/threonine protein kinase [Actinomycetia bacterium]|nr:serine/threonine protein kinase [Actinomycetes bacterium]
MGSGAFASVWLAHDEVLEAPVAIKVLAGSLLDDLDVRNRFLEEARILRRADSERLVRVHDIGELTDGRPYFVMSYADRGTLAERMRERPLPVSEAIAIAEEIAYGVEVINRLGVIHRDLKPSNVLFQTASDGTERLLIADLGLAKALAHASGAFTLPVGTPGYMSPEQAKFGGGLDVRADVYGLGALTFHLLTGRPPGPAPVKITPSQLKPELGPAFDEIILRALEADREKRWPTAEAFAQALSTLRPTEAPRPGEGPPYPSHGPADDATRVEGTPMVPPGTPPSHSYESAGPTGPDRDIPFGARTPPAPMTAADVPQVQGPVPERPAPQAEPEEDATQAIQRPGYDQQAGGPGRPPGGPPPQAYGQPPTPGSPDDIRTAEVRVPPGFREPQRPPPDDARTRLDPGTNPDDMRTTPGGEDGKTAIFSPGQLPGGQGGPARFPQDSERTAADGPPGPSDATPYIGSRLPPGGPPHGGLQHGGPPYGGPPPGGRPPGGGPPVGGGTGGKRKKLIIPIGIAIGVLAIASIAGLLIGTLFSGNGKKPGTKTPTPDPNSVTVTDTSGRITVTVPKEWPKGPEPTWLPSSVGLADTKQEPVLRATPSVPQFRNAGTAPGVFVGLTTDVAAGKLPPVRAASHPQCTKGQPEPYNRGTLKGTVTHYTACKTGTPSVTEVGLTDTGGKFGVWIRIRQTDATDRTKKILDSLVIK